MCRCCICLDPLQDNITLPCGHVLHIQCAVEYFLFQRCSRVWVVRCPYCRRRINDDYKFNVYKTYMQQLRRERKSAKQQLVILKSKLHTRKITFFFAKLFRQSDFLFDDTILYAKINNLNDDISKQTRLIFKIQWSMWSL